MSTISIALLDVNAYERSERFNGMGRNRYINGLPAVRISGDSARPRAPEQYEGSHDTSIYPQQRVRTTAIIARRRAPIRSRSRSAGTAPGPD